MKILFLSNFYPPYELGGYEQLCHEVSVRLQERGHSVEVLTSRYGIPNGDTSGENGAGVIRALELQSDIYYYRPADFFLKRSRQNQANLRCLYKTLNHVRPDAVVVWGMWNLSLSLPYWAEQWLPGRVGYYIASYWPLDEDPHSTYWKQAARHKVGEWVKVPLRRLALSRLRRENYPPQLQFNHVVCVSQFVRRTLVSEGELPDCASVIYNGIEVKPFLQAGSDWPQEVSLAPLRLLYFGRLIADKGVHTAIEAIALLGQQGLVEKVCLTIVGSGHPAYESYLRELVHELGVAQHVQFVSQLARDEIAQTLKNFDVFLFTSIWPEPMARSVMEAMAAGLLVIGTPTGGQSEMLDDGHNALTFCPGDAIELAAQIAKVARDPLLRQRLAQAGQQMVVEKFSIDRMVDEMELFVQSIALG